jgi:tetratricopeptide (TPR) repeat protein
MSSSTAQSAGRGIVPFWNRVPLFFLFPLHVTMLGRIALFCILPALGVFAMTPPMMVVAVLGLSLVVWIGFLRFGSRVLSETSLGHLAPRQYSQFDDESLAYMPFKIFALFLVSGLVVGVLAAMFGGNVAIGANMLVSLVTPAAIIVLVVSRSLFAGLNPMASLSVMTAIGKPYFLLCLFLFSLSTAEGFLTAKMLGSVLKPLIERWAEIQGAVHAIASQADADEVTEMMQAFSADLQRLKPRFAATVFLISAVAMYFTLIAFNMLGYVTYQYHAKLGLEVDDEPETVRRGAGGDADPEAKQIAALVAAGKVEQALDIAYEAQRLDAENVPAQERYHKLLHLAGKDDRLLSQTNRLLPLLLRQGKKHNALEVLRRMLERQPLYLPEQAEHILAMAEIARSERLPKLALMLLAGFEQKWARSALLPEALFLSGRILCEDLRDDAKADGYFSRVCEAHAAHPKAVEAQRFRDVLARMASGPVAAG